ncbi:hypothetical protein [Salinibaculum rarum]|uniref:hypothetical protein n=1 Tax=Salinibaculum rarum TaxID=3058903 RepID=UPI00265E16F9|nr:hypothetical protein [Salinibaculum sp. KK48]
MHWSVLSWEQFRGMALYRQFIVGMMLAFAVWMGVVTALFAAGGEVAAVGTLVVALVVGVGALTVVPATLAGGE